MFLARALFDNVAETPDELAFRKGDVLTVLEQDTKGLDGWWHCSIGGKSGIAPGNRLKIVSEIRDGAPEATNKRGMELYDQPNQGQQDYDVPPSSKGSSRKPSCDILRNYSGTRKAIIEDDTYDTPPSSKRSSAENTYGIYDTPPSSKRVSSERTPPHSNRSSASRESGSNLLSSKSPSQLSLNLQQVVGAARRRSESLSSENCNELSPASSNTSLDRILSEEGPPIYETLSPSTSMDHLDTEDPTYDTPPSRNRVLSQTNLVSQVSLGSAASRESLLSTASSVSSAHISQSTSLPDSARSSMDLPSDVYDVPRPSSGVDRSRKQLSMDSGLGFYDSPVRSRPSSSTSNTVPGESLKSSQSSPDCKPSSSFTDFKRSKSLENSVDDTYDIPRNNTPKINKKKSIGVTSSNSITTCSGDTFGVYDIPPQVTRDSVISMKSDSSEESQRLSSSSLDSEQQMAEILLWGELLLDIDSALELLVKRQQDVLKATTRLSSFVNNTWRSRSSLEKTLYDIKVSCTKVKNSLRDFVDFSHGSIANAARLPDRQLVSRLQKHLSPLHSTLDLVNKSFTSLEEMKWQVSLLCEPLDKSRCDHLGQIALVAKELVPEVKKVASLIQSSGPTLFKKGSVGDAKTPMSSKPPVVPKLGDPSIGKAPGPGKPKSMQHRPLPAVPSCDKQSPEDKQGPSLYHTMVALHDDDYVECDDFPLDKNPEKTLGIMAEIVDDSDYVQLDSSDSPTRSSCVDLSKDNDKNFAQNNDDVLLKTNSNNLIKSSLQTKSLEAAENDLELIPVKEKASKCSSVFDSKCPDVREEESIEADDQELSEEDLKTPVNLNSSTNETDFILPPPPLDKVTNDSESLHPNDHQVLVYYADQMNTHSTLLANAIDAFIGVVGSKEPPNVFISHSKFVIVSAHKLVHIGDSIHRSLISNSVSMKVMQCANHLCDCLKASVTATKTAALQYPSAPAVQEMVDRVVAVSHAAHELKLVIVQAAKQ